MRRLNQFKRKSLGAIAAALVAVGAFALWTFAQENTNPPPLENVAVPAPVEGLPADGAPAIVESNALPADAAPITEVQAPPALGGDVAAEGQIIPMHGNDSAGIETVEGKNLINVTVENETLENVVNMFARISGANIVTTSADLGGTVTVNLRGVEWKPALGSILDIHNLALVEKLPGSGVYTIVPKPSADTEPLIVQTVFLNFTTVTEMAPLIRSMLGTVSNAAVSDFPSRNAMVIKTTEPNMLEIQTLVHQMDVPGRQVIVEAKFLELSDNASKQLGIRWDSLESYRVGLQPGPFTYDRSVDRTSTRENANNNSEANSQNSSSSSGGSSENENVALFDKDGVQREDYELTLFDPNPNIEGDEVIQQTIVPTRTITDISTAQSANGNAQSIQQDITHNSGDSYSKVIHEGQAAIMDFDRFNAVISALEKTEGVAIISNPKLIVASGSKDAFFTVGEREPIIKTETLRGTQNSPGDTITANLDTKINTEYIKEGYLETGIKLLVVPVVKTDDLIEAMISPKLVRRLPKDKTVGDNSWPRIAVKEIRTTFTLRSGQTVAIGGLTDNKDSKIVTKIPFLGDIPLIGKYLFSHTADMKEQVETIIFVTLTMAESEGLYREAGIPDEARLVHKNLIQTDQKRQKFEGDLEDMRKAADAESAKQAKERLQKHGQ